MTERVPAPDHSGLTATTDAPLYWCAYGRGDPGLLVLHGGPGAQHDYLLPQFLALAKQRRVYFYDQRGGGRSRTDAREEITWRTHVTDLARVAEELTPARLTLVGYSWGGLLALLYALTCLVEPDWLPVSRIILVDPAPLWKSARDQFEADFRRRQQSAAIEGMRAELTASGLKERDPDGYRQRAFELSVAGYFADPRRSVDLTPFRVVGRVQESVWNSLGAYDLVPQLSHLKMPSLIVHGRHDPIPLESSERAARAMNARFVVMEGSGHVPYVEQPDALFSAIEHFLTDTD